MVLFILIMGLMLCLGSGLNQHERAGRLPHGTRVPCRLCRLSRSPSSKKDATWLPRGANTGDMRVPAAGTWLAWVALMLSEVRLLGPHSGVRGRRHEAECPHVAEAGIAAAFSGNTYNRWRGHGQRATPLSPWPATIPQTLRHGGES